MKRFDIVNEGSVPTANRFEIRRSSPARIYGYGREQILSQHNNPVSVVIEAARLKAQAIRLDRQDLKQGSSSCFGLGLRQDRMFEYQVWVRRDHTLLEPVPDTFPAVIVREEKWSTARPYFLDHFCEVQSWGGAFFKNTDEVIES